MSPEWRFPMVCVEDEALSWAQSPYAEPMMQKLEPAGRMRSEALMLAKPASNFLFSCTEPPEPIV